MQEPYSFHFVRPSVCPSTISCEHLNSKTIWSRDLKFYTVIQYHLKMCILKFGANPSNNFRKTKILLRRGPSRLCRISSFCKCCNFYFQHSIYSLLLKFKVAHQSEFKMFRLLIFKCHNFSLEIDTATN